LGAKTPARLKRSIDDWHWRWAKPDSKQVISALKGLAQFYKTKGDLTAADGYYQQKRSPSLKGLTTHPKAAGTVDANWDAGIAQNLFVDVEN
jgi:hypothetical protein